MYTGDAIIDDALSLGGHVPPQVLAELKLMHRRYLAHYVG
jgi:hypothetical protein